MACHHPITAWRTKHNRVIVGKEQPAGTTYLQLPCGKCLGCVTDNARKWALRCNLELTQHLATLFTTLTYAPENEPTTLTWRHVQLFLKRLRRHRTIHSLERIRYFASGEYGEKNGRPHYHLIIFGADALSNAQLINDTWKLGITQTYPVTPAAINYVAGYTAKKLNWQFQTRQERVTPDGEVYTWEPPFIKMSRNPGLAAHAKQWPEAWKLYAVYNGAKTSVPRYLHNFYKYRYGKPLGPALPEWYENDLRELFETKLAEAQKRDRTQPRLEAEQQLLTAKQALRAARRAL